MQSGYGLGLLIGAALAGNLVQRCEPRTILVAGPALSTLAAVLLLLAPSLGFAAGFAGLFLIGFGPMLWLVCQTGIRQTVTPPELLGRVAALIQVAIYGVRPLGALAGGATAAAFGLDAAMALVTATFALSLAVPLTSALGRLRAMPAAAGL
jgi:predicted MFS family arabinose efflux permease